MTKRSNELFDHVALLNEFNKAASLAEVPGWPCEVVPERLYAPHKQPHLPHGYGAVYVFSLCASYGLTVAAGPGAVLKVGKAGAQSNPRFYSQHYTQSAGSTLAKSLLKNQVLCPLLGTQHLTTSTVKSWMMQNLDRTHYFVPAAEAEVRSALEIFIRAHVGSIFEGA